MAWLTGADRAPLRQVMPGDCKPAPLWPQADMAAVAALGAAIERAAATAETQVEVVPAAAISAAGSRPAPRRTVRPLASQIAMTARRNVRSGKKARPIGAARRSNAAAKPKPIRNVSLVARSNGRTTRVRPQTALPMRKSAARKVATVIAFPGRNALGAKVSLKRAA
jgi:hypothetical protein